MAAVNGMWCYDFDPSLSHKKVKLSKKFFRALENDIDFYFCRKNWSKETKE